MVVQRCAAGKSPCRLRPACLIWPDPGAAVFMKCIMSYEWHPQASASVNHSGLQQGVSLDLHHVAELAGAVRAHNEGVCLPAAVCCVLLNLRLRTATATLMRLCNIGVHCSAQGEHKSWCACTSNRTTRIRGANPARRTTRGTCVCSQALLGSTPFSTFLRNGCVFMSAPHLHMAYNFVLRRTLALAVANLPLFMQQVMCHAGHESCATRLLDRLTRAASHTSTPLGTPRR